MDKKWMMETFPNYTEDMYEGNQPSYYNDYINGKGAHFNCRYGSLDLDPEGNVWSANITLGDKNNTIYIVGEEMWLMHIPYDGISHYWKWHNKEGWIIHGKDCLPKYPKDYIAKLMKKKRPDRDGSFVWETVKEKFIDEFVRVEGEFV